MTVDTSASRDRLLIFTRFPEPGRAKTRLIPLLGEVGAAELHESLMRRTMSWVERLCEARSVDLQIQVTGESPEGFRRRFGGDHEYKEQSSGDLGARMTRAFEAAFEAGDRRVLVVGVDCPRLDETIVRQALDGLETRDVVVGPTFDGGYYLIGLRRMIPELFTNIAWGGPNVLKETLARAETAGAKVQQLPALGDVDYPGDLSEWRDARSEAEKGAFEHPRLTVVIPTRLDTQAVKANLESLRPNQPIELIVVEGGQDEASKPVAQKWGAQWLASEPGRARQMNAGARLASTPYLLFLHADTKLPPRFDERVLKILANPKTSLGAFRLRFDSARLGIRFVAWAGNVRSRVFGLPYGDQALFLRRDVFERLGGFPDQPIMEDFELVRRARKLGKVKIAREEAITSARRWNQRGVLWTSTLNFIMVVAYRLRVSPVRLARWYYGRQITT